MKSKKAKKTKKKLVMLYKMKKARKDKAHALVFKTDANTSQKYSAPWLAVSGQQGQGGRLKAGAK
jgi:hypothetical protein